MGCGRGRLHKLLWFVGSFILFVIIIVHFFFPLELANRVELEFQVEKAEVGLDGGQPVSEEARPASQAPKTLAPP